MGSMTVGIGCGGFIGYEVGAVDDTVTRVTVRLYPKITGYGDATVDDRDPDTLTVKTLSDSPGCIDRLGCELGRGPNGCDRLLTCLDRTVKRDIGDPWTTCEGRQLRSGYFGRQRLHGMHAVRYGAEGTDC